MSLYLIVVSAAHVRPPHYWPSTPGNSTPDPGAARKFSTAGDAAVFLSDRRIDPDLMPVVPADPATLAAAETAAVHAWNHRDCHAENGRAA